MKSKLLIYFLPAILVMLLIYGYGTQDNPSSDADNVDSKIQQQVNEMTSNSPNFLSPGNQNEVLAAVPDTILYKGPIPAYPAGVFGHGSNWLGDTLYVCGGSATGTASTNVYTYSITSNTWSTGVSMPVAKTGGSLVKCGNALYYIGGGSAISGTTATPNTLRYRVGLGWDEVAPIPTPVVGNSSACWGDSVIYCLLGGWTQYYRGTQIYRPSTNTWSRASDSLPAGAGRRSLAGGIVGNKLYVACGFSGAFRKDMYIGTISGDGSTVAWALGPEVPCRGLGMSRPGGTGFDGHFYVIGAETSPAPALQDSIFIFNTNTNTWLVPLSGRGTGTASNYWGAISAKDVSGKTTVFIPGGVVTGTTTFGLYVATSRSAPPPVGNTLVLVHDTTITSTTQRKADRDTLNLYLPGLVGNYTMKGFDATSVFPDLSNYNTIILQETSFDAVAVRYLGATARSQIIAWLTTGTPASKKSLISIGADQAYNYSRATSPAQDLVFAETYCKMIYRVDNAAATNPIVEGVTINTGIQTPLSTAPPGGSYWPDGSSVVAGGSSVLFRYLNHTIADTVAGIGNVQPGYVVASLFQDPRYYTGGFRSVFAATIGWVVANGGLITGIGNNTSVLNLPDNFNLSQNYPNPFNPTTKINYTLPTSGLVTLKVYDILGKEVASLVNEVKTSGRYEVQFNASNLSSGTYFYRLETGKFVETKKMLLLK